MFNSFEEELLKNYKLIITGSNFEDGLSGHDLDSNALF